MDIQPVTNLRILKYVGDDKKAEWAKHFLTEGFKGKTKKHTVISHAEKGRPRRNIRTWEVSITPTYLSVLGPCGLSQKSLEQYQLPSKKWWQREKYEELTMAPLVDTYLAVEAMLEKTAGTYSFGDSITMADLALVPQVYNGVR